MWKGDHKILTQILNVLNGYYADYIGCILASAITILNSHFAMWCVLNNCLAREKVLKLVKANHRISLIFLPAAKKYAIEYQFTYCFHVMLYCISLVRIPYILLRIYASVNGWYELQVGGWSFAYLMWNMMFLGLSLGQSCYWNSFNDTESVSVHPGGKLDNKIFRSAESRSRLTTRKERYQIQKKCFITMKTSRSGRWRKKQLLQLACTAQMMQVWIWYLAKNNGYPSEEEKEQEISVLLSEWIQIQHWFEQEKLNRTIERYTDCLIIPQPYLQELNQMEKKYFMASPKRKMVYFRRINICINNMVQRTFDVFNHWNEISYPRKDMLRAMGQDIVQWTEWCRQHSFDFSEDVQQAVMEWIQAVKSDLEEVEAI